MLMTLSFGSTVWAQKDNYEDLYFNFLQIRLEPLNSSEAIKQGEYLLQNHKSDLNSNQIASLTYHLGRLYEEDFKMNEAIEYYKKSMVLNPNYYVPYRALGFYYFDLAIDAYQTANRMQLNNDLAAYTSNMDNFKQLATQTISYLLKAQACDPDEQTLGMITDLYDYLKDDKGKKTIKKQLKQLSKKCVTLLEDQ
jgi:tetratricopeptide (TPR) repeat protein